MISDNSVQVKGNPIVKQATIYKGKGKVWFDDNVQIGYNPSPGFLNEVSYFECRKPDASIIIGRDVIINNSLVIIADKDEIKIGANSLIGDHVKLYNSDFHPLNPEDRLMGRKNYQHAKINIGQNVWLGSFSIVLKGVTIGDNSVIGAGSVVVGDIPPNVVAAGNPAKVIKQI